MKKFLSMLLVGMMMLSFASCSQKSGEDIPTLTWYIPGDYQKDTAAVLEEVNKITEEKIGAKIDIQFLNSFDERMNMIMAGNEEFDLCFTGFTNNYYNAATRGGLLDITDMIEESVLKKEIPQYWWDAATINGAIYAVPNVQICAIAATPYTFKDLAEKYNLDVESVNKWEDLEEYLYQIKENEPDMIPWRISSGVFNGLGVQTVELLGLGIGYDITDEKCEVKWIDMETEAGKKGVEMRGKWYKDGIIRKDALSVGDDSLDYNNGKYAVAQTGWKPGVESSLNALFGREVVFFKNVTTPIITTSNCVSTMIGISRTSKNPEKAFKFIELVNTDKELYNLIAYGIEGKHYTLTEEGKVSYIEESGYAPKASWKFGNQFNALVEDGAEADVWEQTEALNNSACVDKLLGFVFDDSNVTTEVSNCTSVRSEYKYVWLGTALDYREYRDEYIEKMEQAGIRKVIEELQKQIDAFLSSK